MKSSKINSRTRISVKWNDLVRTYDNFFRPYYTSVWGGVPHMAREWGLVITCKKHVRGQGYTYFFKVVDKQKYMLAKLKYEI